MATPSPRARQLAAGETLAGEPLTQGPLAIAATLTHRRHLEGRIYISRPSEQAAFQVRGFSHACSVRHAGSREAACAAATDENHSLKLRQLRETPFEPTPGDVHGCRQVRHRDLAWLAHIDDHRCLEESRHQRVERSRVEAAHG